jgi:hypothetical protein
VSPGRTSTVSDVVNTAECAIALGPVREGLTGVALGLWCLILGLYAASHAASRDLRAAPFASPCGRCAAADGVPRDAGADSGADSGVGSGSGAGSGVDSGAGSSRAPGPQHLILLAPWPAFPPQTPRLVPRSRALFDARSLALQFAHAFSSLPNCSSLPSCRNISAPIGWGMLFLGRRTLAVSIIPRLLRAR